MNRTTFQILAILWTQERSAADVRDRIAARTDGRRPPLTSFYRALAGARQRGWLEIVRGDAAATPGRPPQSYRITPAGREAARAEAARIRQLADLLPTDASAAPPAGT